MSALRETAIAAIRSRDLHEKIALQLGIHGYDCRIGHGRTRLYFARRHVGAKETAGVKIRPPAVSKLEGKRRFGGTASATQHAHKMHQDPGSNGSRFGGGGSEAATADRANGLGLGDRGGIGGSGVYTSCRHSRKGLEGAGRIRWYSSNGLREGR